MTVKSLQFHLSSLLVLAALVGGLWYSTRASETEAQGSACAALAGSLSGYAWSSNIGWIGFEGWPGGELNGARLNSDCSFTGFGWNKNIGWIDFNPPGPFVNGDASLDLLPAHGVRMEVISGVPTGNIIGWARACSPFAGHCWGALDTNNERGGWDGWISFSGTASNIANDPYSVTLDTNTSEFKIDSFAWGGDVVGWLNFCPEKNDGGPNAALDKGCVRIEGNTTVSCSASPNPATLSAGSVYVGFEATVGGSGSYTYAWSGTDDGGWTGSGNPYNHQFTTTGLKTARLEVISGGATIGEATCTVEVTDGSGGGGGVTVQTNGTGSGTVTGTNINCKHNVPLGSGQTGDCDEGVGVSLTASADTTTNPSSVFSGWGGACYNQGANPTCDLSSGGNAIAVFSDTTELPSVCLDDDPEAGGCVAPAFIKIGQQSDGVPAVSSRVYIVNQNPDAAAMVTIASIKDRNNQDLDQGLLDLLTCNFGDNNPESCVPGAASYLLPPVPDARFPFSVTVKDLSTDLLLDSPYTITFSVLGGDVVGTKTIDFRYQPTNPTPQ